MARKCRGCKTEIPSIKDSMPVQKKKFCDFDCMAAHGLALARKAQEKAQRAKHRADKERLKTKSQHAKEAQTAFNAYIRKRDEHLPCISCQRHHTGQYHAGHYRSVGGNPELRFEPLNTHKQCQPCNTHLSGNLIDYRINLIKKIGQAKVDWLEGPHEPKRYTIEQLKEITKHYKAKLKDLK